MISIKKYAAIDIGSNAMRLLITNVVEQAGKETQFNKSALNSCANSFGSRCVYRW